MEAVPKPNILLIAGTGQNVGKTTLACAIIERFSTDYAIIAVKISSHFHKKVESGNVIVQRDDLYIAEEVDSSKSKDSARFLASGAIKSYFVMAADEQLPEVMNIIESLNPIRAFFVCESGGLRKWFIPGVFLLMNRADMDQHKPGTQELRTYCDRWITFDGHQIDFSLDKLEINGNKWHLKD
jgi:hypothetical protein